jgi:hypothetical protein
VQGAQSGFRVDVRTKAGDPATSLVDGGKAPAADGTVSLIVADEDGQGDAAIVVVIGSDGLPRAQAPTMVGG